MNSELKKKLQLLAEKYETADFLEKDPSQFLRWYKEKSDIEAGSFIAAMLSFGARSQFIPKIKEIFELADKAGGMTKWLTSGQYDEDFVSPTGNDERKFYRFYSYEDMKRLFSIISNILLSAGSLGEYVKTRYEQLKKVDSEASQAVSLCSIIGAAFPGCDVVSKGKGSANKRIHMFLRWMIRQKSPVDLGLWVWAKPSELLIPVDVHVLSESVKLGLIEDGTKADFRAAQLITQEMKQIWPEDPCKGDFALFGLGVDK